MKQPKNIAGPLHEAIAKVAPITGVSIGKEGDRKTWTIHFAKGAKAKQKKDAQAVLKSFDPDKVKEPKSTEEKLAKLMAWAKTKGFKE